MEKLTISKTLVMGFMGYANTLQVPLDEDQYPLLFQALNDKASNLIPFQYYAKLYTYVLEKTQNPILGLHEGEQYNLAALGIVGQMIQVCENVGEAIVKSSERFNLISNVIQFDVQLDDDRCIIYFDVHEKAKSKYEMVTRQMVMASMAFTYRELDFLSLTPPAPIEVGLNFDMANRNELNRVFNTTATVRSDRNFLMFEASICQLPILYADYELLTILEKVACKRLENQQTEDISLESQIKKLIYSMLDPKVPPFDVIAFHLNMSTRHLQRHLKLEGTSYSKIIEVVKKDLAIDYLKQNLSIKEVSFLMGYAEPSGFVNAFKNWFGQSPSKYRASLK